jgi:hypothetical protein
MRWVWLALLVAGCAGHRPALDPKLEWPQGDPEAGRQAFQNAGCVRCHLVEGSGLPKPTIEPPVPVVFGRPQPSRYDRTYLFRAIVNPNLHIAEGHTAEAVTADGSSRMGDFTRALTVRDLIDIVAFLQRASDRAYEE